MARLLPLFLLATCGEVLNPDPVAPGAPLSAAQIERAISELVPADAVAVAWVRSLDAFDALQAAADGLSGRRLEVGARMAEGAGLPRDAIDPALPAVVAVCATAGRQQVPRLSWVLPLKDPASADAMRLPHAVHARYVGVSDDPAYGRGGGSPLARGLPGEGDAGVRFDVVRVRELLGPGLDLGLAMLPGRVLGGAGGAAPGVSAALRAVVDAGRTASLELKHAGGGTLHVRGTYVVGEAPAAADVGDLWARLPAAWPLAVAGPLDARLGAALPPPWRELLGDAGRACALAVKPGGGSPAWCAVLRPADPDAFVAACAERGIAHARRDGDFVVVASAADAALGGGRARPERAVALFRADASALASLFGVANSSRTLRLEGRISLDGNAFDLDATLALQR